MLRKFFSSNDENTCDWQSTCYQTVLTFRISLTEISPNPMWVGSMEISDESASMVVSAVFNTREHVDPRKVF